MELIYFRLDLEPIDNEDTIEYYIIETDSSSGLATNNNCS